MLKAKVLGKEVFVNEEGSLSTDDKEVFEKLVENIGVVVDTSIGKLMAGTADFMDASVLFFIVDKDYEVISDDEDDDAVIVQHLLQKGDVIIND